jgi:predicted phosphodiesterase
MEDEKMKRIYNFLLIFALVVYGSTATDVFAQNSSNQNSAALASAKSLQKSDPSLPLTLPLRENSIRFLAVGDTGRGNRQQQELANVMLRYRQVFPYEFVILTGDNIYYQEKAEDLKTKFENVYRPLLDQGVKFYASLGNHDESNQRFYEHFNMNGEEYFRFEKGGVSFYSLNSNYMDKRQIKWIEDELAKDTSKWQISFFHHPPYSSGKRHGSEDEVREVVEPLFLKSGIDVVFTGHEHFYERVKPQKGIYYFITGAGGEVRKNGIRKKSPLTEKGFDQDLSFMLVEIAGDEMHFQVISRTGATVDSGVIMRRN